MNRTTRDVLADARLWHGGWPGMRAGDLLLPPSVTGNARQAKNRAEQLARHRGLDPDVITPDDTSLDWVHFTPHRNVALAYAGSAGYDFGSGALYVIDPIGDVDVDPDLPIQCLRAHSARIVSVYDTHVNMPERRIARLHAAVVAVERGTTARQQMVALERFAYQTARRSRPAQTIMMIAAQDRGTP